jgi:hypothetical protein
MANSSIIDHMLRVLDQYEAKAIRAAQVEAFLEQYVMVLEGVSPDASSLVQQYAARLTQSDSGLAPLRVAIRALSGEPDPDIIVTLPGAVPAGGQ